MHLGIAEDRLVLDIVDDDSHIKLPSSAGWLDN
jgi:hypothetical protein